MTTIGRPMRQRLIHRDVGTAVADDGYILRNLGIEISTGGYYYYGEWSAAPTVVEPTEAPETTTYTLRIWNKKHTKTDDYDITSGVIDPISMKAADNDYFVEMAVGDAVTVILEGSYPLEEKADCKVTFDPSVPSIKFTSENIAEKEADQRPALSGLEHLGKPQIDADFIDYRDDQKHRYHDRTRRLVPGYRSAGRRREHLVPARCSYTEEEEPQHRRRFHLLQQVDCRFC